MSQADEQEEEQVEEEPAPSPKTGPAVRPIYIVVLLGVVLGGGGLALTGPVCDTKNIGQELKDLTRQELTEQAINRIKDLRTTVTFSDTTRVMSKPTPINPSVPGVIVNRVMSVKPQGETIEVVTHIAGNGYVAYKVRLPDGACGYVFSTDRIRVVSQ
ncbi:MAG: hypothetical protein ACREI9_02170 [Nitrospiraceae bacterium]